MNEYINKIINDDCFNILPKIKDESIDLILTDPPYNINLNLNWDRDLNFKLLFKEFRRIIKRNGIMLITCNLKLLIKIYNENKDIFRFEIIWDKINNHGNFVNIKKMPGYRHEYIILLSFKAVGNFTYNPQFEKGKPYKNIRKSLNNEFCSLNNEFNINENNGYRYPVSIIKFKSDNRNERGLHPTQKPVELFSYLIKTYSNENNLVLDCFSGSGTTAIACIDNKRNFICIEKDKDYYKSSINRINDYQEKQTVSGIKYRIIGK